MKKVLLLGLSGLTLLGCSSGEPGATGSAGMNGVLSSTAEPAGANCAAGGTRIDYGTDKNANGKLDADEVSGTSYVCAPTAAGATGADGATGAYGGTGATGATGFASLIKLTPEPSGSNCALGGTRVDVGLDHGDGGGLARNGNLETGEIDSTAYVCVASDLIAPGSLATRTKDGWSVRCLSWSGGVCTRPQVSVACGTCSSYAPRVRMERPCPSPVTSRSTYASAGVASDPQSGLLAQESYCGSDPTLLQIRCDGW